MSLASKVPVLVTRSYHPSIIRSRRFWDCWVPEFLLEVSTEFHESQWWPWQCWGSTGPGSKSNPSQLLRRSWLATCHFKNGEKLATNVGCLVFFSGWICLAFSIGWRFSKASTHTRIPSCIHAYVSYRVLHFLAIALYPLMLGSC